MEAVLEVTWRVFLGIIFLVIVLAMIPVAVAAYRWARFGVKMTFQGMKMIDDFIREQEAAEKAAKVERAAAATAPQREEPE